MVNNKINTKDAFDVVAEDFNELSEPIWPLLRQYLNEILFSECKLNKVLDIANGGIQPSQIFNNQILNNLQLFVGNDVNLHMLKRNNYNYRINSDFFTPPFKDKSFDTILVISCIHHFGLKDYKDKERRVNDLFKELKNLLSESGCVIIIEATLPLFFEIIERLIIIPIWKYIFGKRIVPIYLYETNGLKKVIYNSFDVEYYNTYTTSELTGEKWKLYPPLIFMKWLKIPMFLLPYRYNFFRCRTRKCHQRFDSTPVSPRQ
ncbi:MAG: class I SAM-dependent methyltransferase [Chloroflexi bacterium]|nr:class I SAM-dependent methyltransferase [Chloroflexota bacterium]